MDIHVSGSRPTRRAPKENFTGSVLQDPINMAPAPARLNASRVSFEPGARTAWHTHPLGQTLYVISGIGRVQAKGGPIREIRPGDVVWIPPNAKHWQKRKKPSPSWSPPTISTPRTFAVWSSRKRSRSHRHNRPI